MPESGAAPAISPEVLLGQARVAVALALAAGADDAAATVRRRRGTTFRWRDGRLEQATEDAARSLSVAVYADGRYSVHVTNDLDAARLRAFVEEAVRMTRHLQPDPWRRLPDPALAAGRPDVDLDLVDPGLADLPREERLSWCRALEEHAHAHADVVSTTAHVHDSHVLLARATSNGVEGTREQTAVAYGAQVTVRDGERLAEDAWGVAGTHRADLPGPASVGQEALRRTRARQGARKGSSRRTTMVVHPEAAALLVQQVLGALSAGAVQQKRSFLAAHAGGTIASPLLTLTDDPLVPRALGSRPFDSEGLAARRRTVVAAGTLASFYVDTYYGAKLGWAPTTGEASNLLVDLGETDLDGLVSQAGEGILVGSWLGGNANLATGDFSFGIRGHEIRGGAPVEPVAEMNATGNYLDLLRNLSAVGNDPVPWSACRTPTLVFSDVQFSGA